MNRELITTALELPNHRITRSLGVVRGITVRSRSVFGTIGASLQTLRGGNITLFTELCETSREEAFEKLKEERNDEDKRHELARDLGSGVDGPTEQQQ